LLLAADFFAAFCQYFSMISARSSPRVLRRDDKNSGEFKEASSALITLGEGTVSVQIDVGRRER